MADTVLCGAGWLKDPWHTAADAPCVATSGWLSGALTVIAVAWALYLLTCASIIAVLVRRAGAGWSSLRVLAYGSGVLSSAGFISGSLLLGANLEGQLADRWAPWRALWLAWFVIFHTVQLPMLGALWLEPAAALVGGVDVARHAQLKRVVTLGGRAFLGLFSLGNIGIGVALYGATAAAQDAGVVVFFCCYAGAVSILAALLVKVAGLLVVVHADLNAASSTAAQVGALSKAMKTFGMFCAQFPIILAVLASVGTLRALAGLLIACAGASNALLLMPVLLVYERSRLGNTDVAKNAKVTPSGRLGSAGAADAIATYANRTSDELTADVQRLAAVRREQNRPEGLAHDGVSLAFMKQFADEFGVDAKMSAAEVCANHVKPTTDKVKLSLVATVQGGGGSGGAGTAWVGAPTHFISYGTLRGASLLPVVIRCARSRHIALLTCLCSVDIFIPHADRNRGAARA
jgi:hypothetical protein